MLHRFHKHKLVLDENFSPREKLPRLNGLFDVKHLRGDLKKEGISDLEVYKLAVRLQRIIITFNAKDFIKLAGTKEDMGIIGISSNLSKEQIDKKLTALLTKKTERALQGKFISITGKSKPTSASL